MVALVSLYYFLKTSLPHYSSRVPFLGVLLLAEYLVYNFITDVRPNFSRTFERVFTVLWWTPVFLLVIFMVIASIIPLQQWPDFWRIYLPGVAIMTIISKIILFVFLIFPLLLDLIRRVFKFEPGIYYFKLIKFLKRMAIFLGSLAFVGLFIGSVHWVSKFTTHNVEIEIDNLPNSLDGLKIIQLSDIHLGSWSSTRPIEKAVNIVNSLDADIIVFTGDLVNYSSVETIPFENALKKLKAKRGIYAILGNHDYGDYVSWPDSASKAKDFKNLEDFYQKIGWKLLRNEHIVLDINGSSLLIAGVENWSATARFHRYGDMVKTMHDAPQTDVSILLSHDPTHWDNEIVKDYTRFNLTLSGHTHGMQMGFEGFGIKWSPSQYIYKNWAGLYNSPKNQNDQKLYVNRGLGHIGYPGRVGILPEITLITLKEK